MSFVRLSDVALDGELVNSLMKIGKDMLRHLVAAGARTIELIVVGDIQNFVDDRHTTELLQQIEIGIGTEEICLAQCIVEG